MNLRAVERIAEIEETVVSARAEVASVRAQLEEARLEALGRSMSMPHLLGQEAILLCKRMRWLYRYPDLARLLRRDHLVDCEYINPKPNIVNGRFLTIGLPNASASVLDNITLANEFVVATKAPEGWDQSDAVFIYHAFSDLETGRLNLQEQWRITPVSSTREGAYLSCREGSQDGRLRPVISKEDEPFRIPLGLIMQANDQIGRGQILSKVIK